MTTHAHDRLLPGLNHLAFHAGSTKQVDALTTASRDHGWALMFADRHPHAGGPDVYAAYLENVDGFEVELVADPPASVSDLIEEYEQAAPHADNSEGMASIASVASAILG